MIFEAVAKYRLYGLREGLASLRRVLEDAEKDGIVMPFAENAPHLMDMLNVMENADIENGRPVNPGFSYKNKKARTIENASLFTWCTPDISTAESRSPSALKSCHFRRRRPFEHYIYLISCSA